MARQNKLTANMVGGVVSPKVYGRSDLPLFQKCMAVINNFIAQPQGGCSYRTGTSLVGNTRLNQTAVFIPFQFNDAQSYLIEATDRKFRFYANESKITETPKAIGSLTNANPGVFHVTSHGYNNGDEVYISSSPGTAGLTGVTGRFFIVNNKTTNTFQLNVIPTYDQLNTNIYSANYQSYSAVNLDTTNSGTYTSGGTVARVYEIATPYLLQDLLTLQYSQTADTMYIAHQNYEPRKLTRAGNSNWTLATYSRTADPFTAVTTTNPITGITQANPAVVHCVAHGLTAGQTFYISGVVGMTQANGLFYTVGTVVDADHFNLLEIDGVTNVDSTGWSAYGSGGTITLPGAYPGAVTFIDSGRVVFGGTGAHPETVFGSQAPSGTTTNYDNFTTGTADTDAYIFTLAPINGKVDNIQWLSSTNFYSPIVGTFGSIRVMFGAAEGQPVTPTAVSAKAVNGFGCLRALPVTNGETVFYIQRNGLQLRSMDYDILTNWYFTTDRTLMADHIGDPGFTQIIGKIGRPDIVYGLLGNGKFAGLTFIMKEQVSGWHTHYIAGNSQTPNGIVVPWANVLNMGRMPRTNFDDQMWFVVERYINGATVRTVEFATDYPVYPVRSDFFTGDKATDDTKYGNVLYEAQKNACHLDMSLGYRGDTDSLASDTNLQFALDASPPQHQPPGYPTPASAGNAFSPLPGQVENGLYTSTLVSGNTTTIAVSPDGLYLYILAEDINDVNMFAIKVSTSTGAVVAQSVNLAPGGMNTCKQIFVTPDGSKVIAVFNNFGIATYSVYVFNATDLSTINSGTGLNGIADSAMSTDGSMIAARDSGATTAVHIIPVVNLGAATSFTYALGGTPSSTIAFPYNDNAHVLIPDNSGANVVLRKLDLFGTLISTSTIITDNDHAFSTSVSNNPSTGGLYGSYAVAGGNTFSLYQQLFGGSTNTGTAVDNSAETGGTAWMKFYGSNGGASMYGNSGQHAGVFKWDGTTVTENDFDGSSVGYWAGIAVDEPRGIIYTVGSELNAPYQMVIQAMATF